MFRLTFYTYSGMRIPIEEDTDLAWVRRAAARFIRKHRRSGDAVPIILERGERWEFLEPEDAVMVGDANGTLSLSEESYECRECGSACSTKDDARQCAFNDWHGEDYTYSDDDERDDQ